MKRSMVPLLLALAGAAPATYADEPSVDDNVHAGGVTTLLQNQRVSGVLRANYYRSSKNFDDETDFLGATAQIKQNKVEGKFFCLFNCLLDALKRNFWYHPRIPTALNV